MPLYSPGNNSIDMLLQKLAAYNRKVTALPNVATAINSTLSYNGVSYQSNGTNWLSTTLYSMQMQPLSAFVNNLAATTATAMVAPQPDEAIGIYVTKLVVVHRTLTTMTSTQNWTFTFNRGGAGGTFAAILTAQPTWQTGRTPGIVYNDAYAVNAFYSVGTNTPRFSLDANKVSTPGNLEITGATIWYKLAGA